MQEMRIYGYSYSMKNQIMSVIFATIGLIVLAQVIGLRTPQILILLICILIGIPRVCLNIYRNMYEQKKFMDVSNYVEQMLYSFKRKSKILMALEDTAILFPDGLIGEMIQKSIDYINQATTEGNVYEEGFRIIEEEYGCDIVRRIHTFMSRVELYGGEYEESIEILILDRNRWVSRTLETQKEKNLIKRNVAIGIILSLLVVTGTIFMVPTQLVDIRNNLLAQYSTVFTLLLNFWLWVFVQTRLSGSWIETKSVIPFAQIEKDYVVVKNTNSKRKLRMSGKRLRKEVEKAFPDWMLELTLLLQTENVQVAIQNSIEQSPFALRAELELLQEKIEKNPTSINPYLEFYEELHIHEIQSAMRMLYSLSQNGGEDMTKQIQALVERNVELQDQSARLRTEDYLAGLGFCVLIPMAIGCGKMLLDMALLMYGILCNAQAFY